MPEDGEQHIGWGGHGRVRGPGRVLVGATNLGGCLNDRPASDKWHLEVGPLVTLLRDSTEMNRLRLKHQHVVDAQGVFDALAKDATGSPHDRRTSIDLALERKQETLPFASEMASARAHARRSDDESGLSQVQRLHASPYAQWHA